MKLCDKISMAFKDLMNRKLRSALTIIAVSIGAFLLIVMMGLGDGIIKQTKDLINSFGDTNIVSVYPMDKDKLNQNSSSNMEIEVKDVNETEGSADESSEEDTSNKSPAFKKISNDDLEIIKGIDGVEKISAYVQGKVTEIILDDNTKVSNNITLMGYDFNNDIDVSDKLVAGNILKNEDKDIIISEDLVSKLGFSNKEDILNKNIKVQAEYPEMNGIKVKDAKNIEGNVIGVINKKDYPNQIIMSEKKAEPLLAYFTNGDEYLSKQGYSQVNVYAENGKDLSELASAITSETGYYTFSTDMVNKMLDVFGVVIKAVLSIAGIIVLVVAALGLVNTVSMTLQEKRKMIGVMRSVGCSRSSIRVVFTFQSFFIGLSGALLGVVLAALGIFIVNEYVLESSSFAISLTLNNILVSAVITLVISLVAGIIPAGRAARINVVQAVAEE